MVSGKPPFDSQFPTEIVMMHIRDQPPPLSGVPGKVSAIVMKALSKDMTKRQASCDDMAQECEAAMAGLAGGARAPAPGPAAVVAGSKPATTAVDLQPAAVSAAPAAPAPIAAGSEQKTMMPTSLPPEQMAAIANVIRDAQAARKPDAPSPLSKAPAELKTMMVSGPVALPFVGGTPASPFPNAPAPNPFVGLPPPISMAPTMPPPEAPGAGGAGLGQGTGGTMMLPDSSGVLSFVQSRVEAARQGLVEQPQATAKPAGVFFWLAWVILGLGLGIGVHFLRLYVEK